MIYGRECIQCMIKFSAPHINASGEARQTKSYSLNPLSHQEKNKKKKKNWNIEIKMGDKVTYLCAPL